MNRPILIALCAVLIWWADARRSYSCEDMKTAETWQHVLNTINSGEMPPEEEPVLGHTLRNSPTIVAGGGAGFKHGRHLVMSDPKTPLCNLWLSQLQGSGIAAEYFGDSTGRIEELFVA